MRVCVCVYVCASFSFLRRSLTLLSRLECNGVILAHHNLCVPDSSDSAASVSWVAGITGIRHHAQIIFVFFFLVVARFHHVGQDGLELLTSGDSPTSASQSAGITGVSHHTRLQTLFPEVSGNYKLKWQITNYWEGDGILVLRISVTTWI